MIKPYIVNADISIRDAIEYVGIEKEKIICIVDEKNKLLGIFTGGDLRKYAITSGDMSVPIGEIMNTSPVVYETEEEALQDSNNYAVYPIVDKNGILKKVFFPNRHKDNWESDVLEKVPLVMMAGGKGTRLYPYTKVLPKALIPIGDITIGERIINNFVKYGCSEVFFILNYKAGMIKAYYNELDKSYTTHFEEEPLFLGTGGGLKLLEGKLNSTFIVSNCDILVDADYECAYKTHKMHNNKITFVCAMKNMQIPYGVIQSDENGNIKEIVEKPSYSFLTNTGVYIVEPDVLQLIQSNEFVHFPDIAQRCINRGWNVGVFPVSNKAWLDMGEFSEMDKMLREISENS